MFRAAKADGFRYFDINGGGTDNDGDIVAGGPTGVDGVFRDSAGAAAVALLFADLPGVNITHSTWARCMAKQTVDFMLGQNSEEFSYMVGYGCALSLNRHLYELLHVTKPYDPGCDVYRP